jgi:FtsP/CotA-like multicopper oxidase with cupredoxin domain
MVASAHQVTLDGVTTTAWPYEVCYRPAGDAPNACPAGAGTAPLGGVRLQLDPGDTLRIRLVNKLPALTADQAKHAEENPALLGNPTNLHTHGLIVEPHRAEGPWDTYGDYVFVVVRNPDNTAAGDMAAMAGMDHAQHVHPDMDYVDGAIEYKIDIPDNHPSGLFWFHPHMHGLSLNQVSAGMSGIITIGAPADICADAACRAAVAAGDVKHIVLKDEEVEADGTLLTQEDPAFCNGQPDAAEGPRQGSCAGTVTEDGDHTGGRWYHTLNGQVFPRIDVNPNGDVWRFTNASGSRSYDLSLTDDQTGQPIPLQILAIDGVTVDAQQNADMARVQKVLGRKAHPEACPGSGGLFSRNDAICTTQLSMMPSSRVEVRVLRRDDGNGVRTATLKTNDFFTGGDDWPAVDLAKVNLAPRNPAAPAAIAVGGQATAALSSSGVLKAATLLQVPGQKLPVPLATARQLLGSGAHGPAIQAASLHQAPTIAIDPALKLGERSSPDCQPLAPGHRRKIIFGNPTPGEDGFGLGYVEVDENGQDIESTRKPIAVFDPSQTVVCVPLGPDGQAVSEVWEVVNIHDEDHNFHIHQTRFQVLSPSVTAGQTLPTRIDDALVLHDNLPLPHPFNTDGCDGSVEAVKAGACVPRGAILRIPFREVGDFVFHCHILEHEDGGMMARIRVVGAPGT